jgi:hypothetical protein
MSFSFTLNRLFGQQVFAQQLTNTLNELPGVSIPKVSSGYGGHEMVDRQFAAHRTARLADVGMRADPCPTIPFLCVR